MNQLVPLHSDYPLKGQIRIPINSHPGAFGCHRRYNVHEGIDLYGKEGDPVYAISSGVDEILDEASIFNILKQ
jgi:murein DD-endopeptidase MepM/ murein hydrolase activator NlpD